VRVFWRIKVALQVLFRGWGDYELWSLDTPIAANVLPRLKRYRASTIGNPSGLTEEEWLGILDKMIYAMDKIAHQDDWVWQKDWAKESLKVQEGCELFGKYFQALWD